VPPGNVAWPVEDIVPEVGVCAFGIVVGVGFGNVAGGMVAGAGVAEGDALVVFEVAAVLAPYQSLTPLWP